MLCVIWAHWRKVRGSRAVRRPIVYCYSCDIVHHKTLAAEGNRQAKVCVLCITVYMEINIVVQICTRFPSVCECYTDFALLVLILADRSARLQYVKTSVRGSNFMYA